MNATTQTSGDTSGRDDGYWAFDQEGDCALVPFANMDEADGYVARQNAHQGRGRWIRIETPGQVPDRSDGTPALIPQGCGLSIGGFRRFDCAQALDVAAAIAHAAAGHRRIAGHAIATPVNDEVDLEISDGAGTVREWRFQRRDARLLTARMATLAVVCLPVSSGEAA